LMGGGTGTFRLLRAPPRPPLPLVCLLPRARPLVPPRLRPLLVTAVDEPDDAGAFWIILVL
jgi:hypothetical protein